MSPSANQTQWSLLLLLICLQTTLAIINRSPHGAKRLGDSRADGNSYLNTRRPLWILKDPARKPPLAGSAIKKPFFSNKGYWRQARQPSSNRAATRRDEPYKLRAIPQHHRPAPAAAPPLVSFKQRHNSRRAIHYVPRANVRSSRPLFDAGPLLGGAAAADIAKMPPIFIYNGPKGELIFNTMLSAHKYPMQEPVPGQTLYPPATPMFRPKPIVQRFRATGGDDRMNLTLIPFYAHEAINPRSLRLESSPTTDAPPPTVLYAAHTPTALLSEIATKKPRRRDKKQYTAYHSAKEVHWRPPTTNTDGVARTTTPFPLTLASPLQNHRFATADVAPPTVQPHPQPPRNFKLSYADKDEAFQILYVDESLEKPTTSKAGNAATTQSPTAPTAATLKSSRYTTPREYYEFPVFTLGKLLKPFTASANKALPTEDQSHKDGNQVESDGAREGEDTTWFILNSRYKGHQHHNEQYRLSSKYVQKSLAVDPVTVTSVPPPTLPKSAETMSGRSFDTVVSIPTGVHFNRNDFIS